MNFQLLAHEVALVLSAIVLVFWLSYSVMLYHQAKRGLARKDWPISMVFYFGIGLLVFANLVLSASVIYNTAFGEDLYLVINMISMLIFVYGFYLRMKSSVAPDEDKSIPKRKGRQ